MAAKEMFEKLGYEYRKYNQSIIYKHKYEIKQIWFDEMYKVFSIFGSCTINTDELQAINKQVEELKKQSKKGINFFKKYFNKK